MKITVNPDTEFAKTVRKKLKTNSGYCPCAIEKKPEYKCMCQEFIDQPAGTWCRCGLYYKEEYCD